MRGGILMMYSNKQKLAMAMAAAMALSVVPAMSFAAPKDVENVLAELKKENTAETKTEAETGLKVFATATAALAEAKKVQGADGDAMTIVAAYEASLNVLKATTEVEWNTAKTAFTDAVTAMKAANPKIDFKGSFDLPQSAGEGPQYMHNRVFDKIKGYITVDGTFAPEVFGNLVKVKYAEAKDPSKVTLNGTELKAERFWVKAGELNINVNLTQDPADPKPDLNLDEIKELFYELDGKVYRVSVK